MKEIAPTLRIGYEINEWVSPFLSFPQAQEIGTMNYFLFSSFSSSGQFEGREAFSSSLRVCFFFFFLFDDHLPGLFPINAEWWCARTFPGLFFPSASPRVPPPSQGLDIYPLIETPFFLPSCRCNPSIRGFFPQYPSRKRPTSNLLHQ